jgi:ssDNA-binding Zn-finger/Zn-ribbon topoisomerase 1
MRLRQNKTTGDQFFGCPKFPACRGVRNTVGENITPNQYRTGSATAIAPRAPVRDPGVPLDDLIQEIHRLAVQAHDGTVGQCSGNLKKIIELTRASNFAETKSINATAEIRERFSPAVSRRILERANPIAMESPDDEPAF